MTMNSKKASQEALEALHGALAKTLADKIKSGEATAADMAVARQFLKDNGIDSVPTKGSPLASLSYDLPFPNTEGVAIEEKTFSH